MAQVGTHTRHVAWRVISELVIVVQQVDADAATCPCIRRKAILPFGIGANLVKQEAVRATQILLVTQAKAIGKRVRFLLIQGFVIVGRSAVDLGGAMQVDQILFFIDDVAKGRARDADFFHWHVITLVHHSEPLDLIVGGVVQNAAGPACAFGGVEILGLLAIHHQFGITLGDSLDFIACVFLQFLRYRCPVDLFQRCDRCLSWERLRRWVKALDGCLAADKVGMQGNTEQGGIATLPACGQINIFVKLIDCTDIDRRVLNLIVVLRLMFVVVAIVLKLKAQGSPRCLVCDAAKQIWSASKVRAGVYIPCPRCIRTGIESVVEIP